MEKALFCYEDLQALSAAAQKVRGNPVSLSCRSSSHLTGSFESDGQQTLLLTIPYDTGWRLTVDGKPAEYSQVLGIFMAAEIPQGSHNFELRYIPKGLTAGCVISVAASAIAVLWFLKEKKKMP